MESSTAGKTYHLYGHHHSQFDPDGNTHLAKFEYKNNYGKRQHFIYGKEPSGSRSNHLVYGTIPATAPYNLSNEPNDKYDRYSRSISNLNRGTHSSSEGFLYGNDDRRVGQSNVGKKTIPLWLQDRTSAEIKKKQAQAKEIGDYYKQHQQEKASQMMSRVEEKRQDLEMLKNYKPWGKPGGGAPRGFVGDRTQLIRTKHVDHLLDDKEQVLPLGKPGHGAPNRTESGRLKAGLKGDVNVRLQATKDGRIQGVIPVDVHEAEYYRTELDKLAEETRTKRFEEKRQEINDEMESLRHFPFGRPGGGAPLKDEEGKLKAALPLQVSDDIYELRNIELRHPHAFNDDKNVIDTERSLPIGTKEAQRQRRDHVRSSLPDQMETDGLEFGKPGGGAPNFDERGRVITQKPQTLVRDRLGVYAKTKEDSSYPTEDYPYFGRPGAGAPIRDSRGKPVTQVAGRLDKDRLERSRDVTQGRDYLKTLEQMKDEADMHKKQEKEEILRPAFQGEWNMVNSGSAMAWTCAHFAPNVVSWVRRGHVGQPSYYPVTHEIKANPKGTSDVTRQKMEIRPHNIQESRRYHEELTEHQKLQLDQREREEQERRQKSVEHVQTMERIWGKPGHGAPNDNRKRQKVEINPVDYGVRYRDF